MDLIVEHGMFLGYEPVDQPKRKFDIAKVRGIGHQPAAGRRSYFRRAPVVGGHRADDERVKYLLDTNVIIALTMNS